MVHGNSNGTRKEAENQIVEGASEVMSMISKVVIQMMMVFVNDVGVPKQVRVVFEDDLRSGDTNDDENATFVDGCMKTPRATLIIRVVMSFLLVELLLRLFECIWVISLSASSPLMLSWSNMYLGQSHWFSS
ncbi:hypothetical protein Tco_0251820 [Tanacetum coccineum]